MINPGGDKSGHPQSVLQVRRPDAASSEAEHAAVTHIALVRCSGSLMRDYTSSPLRHNNAYVLLNALRIKTAMQGFRSSGAKR